MRVVTWLLVVVAIAAVARADNGTGTVVVGCNEADAELIVDNVLIPERTPAVLTLPAGAHVIEVRKPPLVAQKQVVQVVDQQTVKVRFELVAAGVPAPVTEAGSGSAAGSGSGSAAGSAAGSATGSAMGSAAGSATGSAAPVPVTGFAEIEVATTVASSVVFVDGAPLHAAPCVLELEPGEHVVAVYATGLVPAEALVKLEAGRRQHLDLNPSKTRRRVDVPAQ